MTEFRTWDKWIGAFLWSFGLTPNFEVLDDKVFLVFPHSPELDKLLIAYQNNTPVNVIDYVSRAKTIQGRVNDLKNTIRRGTSYE